MIIIISLIFIILIYTLLYWLYNMYKSDLNDLEMQNIHMQKKMSEMERKMKINEQLINWLCDKVANYKLKGGKKK